MADKWLDYEVVISEGKHDLAKEKQFILERIKPFIEEYKESIEMFHFTRIFDSIENYIRWRIRPKVKKRNSLNKELEGLLNKLKSKKEISGFREKDFGIDSTHNKLGGNPKKYDLFLKFLDAISRITIELLRRDTDDVITGYIPSPDYYAHFLYNQFGSHSYYGICPSCGKGSLTLHPCRKCGAIPQLKT